MNTKLQWLKKIREHLAIPDTIEIWLWWDYVSIPQNNRSNQLKAIASLPNYCSLCSRFVPLVRDGEAWVSMYGDGANTLPVGTLEAYLKRGWCRLEMIAALCPKRLGTSRSWRPGPLNMRFRLHQDPHDPGVGRLLTAKDLADPREGKFNRPDDVLAIQPVLERIAVEYAEYELGLDGVGHADRRVGAPAVAQGPRRADDQEGALRLLPPLEGDVDRLVAGRRPRCVGHVGRDGVPDVGV